MNLFDTRGLFYYDKMAATTKSQKGKNGFLDKLLDKDKPINVDKWDGNAVKNALDDVVRKVFTEKFEYQENYNYIDIRLGISAVGCLVALSALAYDFMFPYPASKYVVITCVITYFCLMSILTMFIACVEKNYILFALEKDKAGLDPDNSWKVATSLMKYDHTFKITIWFQDGVTKEHRQGSLSKSVAEWFDEDGSLLTTKFEADVINLHDSLTSDKKGQ